MKSYTQLTRELRYQIYVLMKVEHTQTEIAATLSVDKPTIRRELKCNKGKRG